MVIVSEEFVCATSDKMNRSALTADVYAQLADIHPMLIEMFKNKSGYHSGLYNSSSWLFDLIGNNSGGLFGEYKGFQGSDTSNQFYFTYGRFTVESILATCVALINLVALLCLCCSGNKKRSPYQMLFTNLAVTNVFGAIFMWTSNNVLYLFEDMFTSAIKDGTGSYCDAFLIMVGTPFISSSFSVVGTFTLLGFSTVHCIVIWKPLNHPTIVRRRTMAYYLISIWIGTFLIVTLPFIIMYCLLYGRSCEQSKLDSMIVGVRVLANINMTLLLSVFLSMLVLCAKIYIDLRAFMSRQQQLRGSNAVAKEEKMFSTTLLLISSMTLFCIPYSLLYVVWLNSDKDDPTNNPAVMYYMHFLPYVKFFLDPIVYGARMRRVRQGWVKLWNRCRHNRPSRVQTRSTYKGSTIRIQSARKSTRYLQCFMNTETAL